MPDGAEIESESGSTVKISVAIPADDAGYFGRECPSCKRIFRMHVDDYEALPDELRLTCPYCCHEDEHSQFFTQQQIDRTMGAAHEYASQLVVGSLDNIFTNMTRRVNSRGGAFRMTYSGSSRSHAAPKPLPAIAEEAPIRERTCDRCHNRYAVFGDHVACPACGPHPPKTMACDALDAQEVALSVVNHVPSEVLAQLRESGALEKTAAGVLGSVVGTIESFLKQTFLVRVPGGAAIIAGKGNVFQRLGDAAQLYKDHLAIDLPAVLGEPDWDRFLVLYGIRHLLTHNNGIADAKHLARFPGKGFVIGERVTVSTDDARAALHIGRRLVEAVP
jgi:transcriptional regulator NrdR family protein